MDWAEFLIVIVLPFGPPLFLWGKHLLNREITRGQLVGVLTWTVLMLAFTTYREMRAEDSWQIACKQLETELKRHADETSDLMPSECVPDESEPRERL